MVSKTTCRGFKSFCPCQQRDAAPNFGTQSDVSLFCSREYKYLITITFAVVTDFVSVIGLEAEALSVPGNSAERARWAKQRGGVGAAVEKDEEKAVKATEVFFGHRKRGCEATSSPSAPAKNSLTQVKEFFTIHYSLITFHYSLIFCR